MMLSLFCNTHWKTIRQFRRIMRQALIWTLIELMMFQCVPLQWYSGPADQSVGISTAFALTPETDGTYVNGAGPQFDSQFDFDKDGDVDGQDLRYFQYDLTDLQGLAAEFGYSEDHDTEPAVAVPGLSGLSCSEAGSILAQLGLSTGSVISVYSSDKADGLIVGQHPAPGSLLETGTLVDLYVSQGPEPETPLPPGSFGGTYSSLIPQDVDVETFSPKQFAMITGLIKDAGGSGLDGVAVTVLDHPEYGSVSTDAAGRFTIPVNGGGVLTVVYEKAGYLPSQRAVDVPWQDFGIAKDTVLVAHDAAATTITPDGNPGTALVHVGSTIDDGDGVRTPVVILPGDTLTTAVAADGSEIPLSGPLTIRATEFTTPESMPAILPPTTAFTYCVDLSIDEAAGAAGITFSKPVSFFLKNFIGFDVGETVPVGYYDQQQGKWIAELDGKVVRLLDTDADGVIDSLDADADSLPDDLNADGNFNDEVFGLDLAGQFSPQDTVWRVETTHFSIFDLNYAGRPPIAQAPSSTAIAPNAVGKSRIPDDNPTRPCSAPAGSRIDQRERVFHEDFPLAGSDMMLHYSSSRVKDYLHKISVPVSGDTIPDSLNSIIVELQVAGNVFTKELAPSANLTTEFSWDGLDVLGNPVTTTTDATISIGFVYTPTYLGYSSTMIANYGIQRSFALPGDYVTAIARDSMAMWKVSKLKLPALPEALETTSLGNGWSITPHHSLITGKQKILVRGDGTSTHPPEGQNLVWTVAGTGTEGTTAPAGPIPATEGELSYPNDIVISPDGIVYILDRGGYIRKVDKDGMMTVIAGVGTCTGNAFLNEGGLAVDTALPSPIALALGPDGSLYVCVSTSYGFLVRRIDPQGIITTVAGDITTDGGWVDGWAVDGTSSPGDGGPATSAFLHNASDIEVGPDGAIYISQAYERYSSKSSPSSNVIRKVDTNGIIQTIAGRGPQQGDLGVIDAGINGAPALDACLTFPRALSLDTNGNLLIGIQSNILSLGQDGLIRTLAGCYGSQECTQIMEIGGPARQRTWYVVHVLDVKALPDGSFYVSVDDWRNSSAYILKVDSTGIIQLFAGQTTVSTSYGGGSLGDAEPALDTLFSCGGPGYVGFPPRQAMALDPEGYLYVADYDMHVVRKIGPAFGSAHPMVNAGEIMIPECPDCPDYGGMGHIFNMGGKHLRTIDLETGKALYEFMYDADNRLVGIRDQMGRVTLVARDAAGRAVSVTGPSGDVTQLSHDGEGNLTRVAYPDGNAYDLGYTGTLITTKTDRVGRTWSYTYDADGRFVSGDDPDGNTLSVSKSVSADEGRSVTTTRLTTREGRVTVLEDRFEADETFASTITNTNGTQDSFSMAPDRFSSQRLQADGTLFTAEKYPDPVTTALYTTRTTTATPAGLTRETVVERSYGSDDDSDGLADTVTVTDWFNTKPYARVHDIAAHSFTTTSPAGRTASRTYDPDTLKTTVLSVPDIAALTYIRDGQGRVAQSVQGDRSETLAYSGAWVSSRTNALSQTTVFDRDAMGRVTGITRADSTAWAFEHDGEGRLTAITEPDVVTVHRFTHTPWGKLKTYTSPMNAVTRFDYDRDGLPIMRQLPSGGMIFNDYNLKGQLTRIQTPEGDHEFIYDGATGHLISAASRDGLQTQLSYDGGLLTSLALSGTLSGRVDLEYDNLFNVIGLTYAGGDTPLTYDDDSLLTGVGSISLARHPGNGLVENIQDGAFSMALTWNEFGEVASRYAVHGSDLYQVDYTRDKLGRIAEKQETVDGTTATFTYAYDAVGRIISVSKDGSVVESAQYDSAGNRIACRSSLAGVNLASGSIRYDADHKLISAGTTSYQYDADGNLIQENRSGSITAFQYNTDGTLARVDLPDGRVITYLYDHSGRRIARAVDGSRTHAWLYGTGLMPLAEFDGGGALRQRFVYADGPVPLVCERGGLAYHIITDHIGSPILVTDDGGSVVKQISYDTWGNVLSDTNPAFDLPFGFAGGMADPDHELIRFGARDYQPSTGRWTAKDPILFNGGLNLYEYAESAPVNLVDRNGLKRDDVEAPRPANVAGVHGRSVQPLPMSLLAGKVRDDGSVNGDVIAKRDIDEEEGTHSDEPAVGTMNYIPSSSFPGLSACDMSTESGIGHNPGYFPTNLIAKGRVKPTRKNNFDDYVVGTTL
ncbi:RHS repeat-associated core domain-containing protein [uncultured Desulfobacter sp.]|uniref:RHS repeat-associated core domain-containing protein n=1 Tax=uncultured Desulfobacter sp. TaxID=240139 RepID=UPI003748B9A3